MNKFSKEYYLYPERIKQQEETKLGKLQRDLKVIQQKKLTPGFLIEELKLKNKDRMGSILEEMEFDLADVGQNVKWLKLEFFDSKRTEIFRKEEDVFNLFKEGENKALEGEVLMREFATEDFQWVKCKVKEFSKQNKKWRVNIKNDDGRFYYDGMNQISEELKNFRRNKGEFFVERICLAFDFEDKVQYAERFVEANINRVLKDSLIRYSFYVNAMARRSEGLGIKDKKRILDKTFRVETEKEGESFSIDLEKWKGQMVGKLKKMFPSKKEGFYLTKVQEIDSTIDEFYGRSINKVVFDYFYKKGETKELVQDAELMLPMDFYFKEPAREKGIVEVSSEEGGFAQAQARLGKNFILKEDKVLKSLKLLNSLSLQLRKLDIFCLYDKGAVPFQGFKALQEKSIYRFRDFLKYEWYQEVFKDLKRKITKKKQVELDQPDDLLGEIIDEEGTQEETPKLKTIFMLKPKYAPFLKVVNMKMKQELEAVLVRQFGKFLRFLSENIPDKIEINGIKDVKSYFSQKRQVEFSEESENQKKKGQKKNKSNPLWFRPCLVSLLMNKVSLGRGEKDTSKQTEIKINSGKHKNICPLEDSPKLNPFRKPLFSAEVVVQESRIKISERPEKFLKFINLIFEKTFRYFYKLQTIEFEVEEPCEKSLITRELIRGLRGQKQTLLNGKEYLFGWAIEGTRRISTKKADCPKDYKNWFQKNLDVVKRKMEANVKKVKQYQNMLGNLQKFILFDFRAYLKGLGGESSETVGSLLEKIDEKKDEISLIESLYPEEVDIGRVN